MAHSSRPVESRHSKYVSSRDTHSAGGWDPALPADEAYGSMMDAGQVGAWAIPPGSVNGGTIDPGGLPGDDVIQPGSLGLTPFADAIRPVAIVAGALDDILMETGDFLLLETGDMILLEQGGSLPTLPDASYPDGCVIYFIDENKLYRNNAGTWDASVDGADIVAGSIVAGKIAAGAIGATEISVSSLSAISANVGTLTAGVLRDSTTKVKLDLDNKKLTVNDGTYDRVTLGDIGGGDYGLVISGPDGDAIIDGTSNVFKIVGSGTITPASNPQSENTTQDSTTTLTALGTFATFPAHLVLLGGTSNLQGVGAYNWRSLGYGSAHELYINCWSEAFLNKVGTLPDYVKMELKCFNYNTDGTNSPASCRWYVLKEVGL